MRLGRFARIAIICGLAVLLIGAAGSATPWLAPYRRVALCRIGVCSSGGACAVQPAGGAAGTALNGTRHLVKTASTRHTLLHTASTRHALRTAPIRHALRTVFLIVLENHNWSSIEGSPSAPYINRVLVPLASRAEQYYNPPGNHPSLPNYLWLEAGTNCGVTDDGPPSINHLHTSRHLVTLLSRAGISWRAYEESITGTTCPLFDIYPYAPKHDPFVYFDDVTGTDNPHSAYCIAHVRPYAELAVALRHNTTARYNFITPNLCDDGHDSCSPLNDPVAQTDAWLARAVPPILRSAAYRHGGVLFITWDEGEGGSDGPIGLLALSPAAKGHGYANTIHYTHSSLLRSMQEIFGVTPLLGGARRATDLRDLFKTFP